MNANISKAYNMKASMEADLAICVCIAAIPEDVPGVGAGRRGAQTPAGGHPSTAHPGPPQHEKTHRHGDLPQVPGERGGELRDGGGKPGIRASACLSWLSDKQRERERQAKAYTDQNIRWVYLPETKL